MDFELNEEQKMFQSMVRDFVDNEIAPYAAQWDETEEFPHDVVKKMADVGLYGLHLPEEYGGYGDDITFVLAVEEVSRGCAGLGASYVTTMSLAMNAIVMHGNKEQKDRYIPWVMQGTNVSFGLTEAMAGSDVANLDTRYERDGDDFILNGNKIFITNGAEADFLVTFATKDKSLGYKGISAFIVEKDFPGFSSRQDRAEDGYASCFGRRAGVRQLPRAGAQPHRTGGTGFLVRPAGHRHVPRLRGCAGSRHRAGGLRCRRVLREGAEAIRRRDSPPSGHPVHDCGHGSRPRRSTVAHLSGGVADTDDRQGFCEGAGNGQTVRLRGRAPHLPQGYPDSRRLRLHS